jgi:phosphopantothenoylcysteine decarboxylase/phosphopantothenate--cysteine ligase
MTEGSRENPPTEARENPPHSASPSAPEIALGVCAGAASFKAVALASMIRKAAYRVRCYLSPDAQHFVTPLSLRTVTHGPVIEDVRSIEPEGPSHLLIAESAAFVIVPATADMIAKIAHGHGSDPVSLAALSAPELRFYVPAMNERMWQNPFVQENCARLDAHGWIRIGPEHGSLAEGYSGHGRMSEPETIFRLLQQRLSSRC